MSSVPIKRGNLNADMHTEGTPREDEGTYWDDVFISQEIPKIASKSPEAKGKV